MAYDTDLADRIRELIAKTSAEPMMMRGRAMRGWLRVDADNVKTKHQLKKWVDIGAGYARSLPAKKKTKKSR